VGGVGNLWGKYAETVFGQRGVVGTLREEGFFPMLKLANRKYRRDADSGVMTNMMGKIWGALRTPVSGFKNAKRGERLHGPKRQNCVRNWRVGKG